jgi:hypothetical protein
VRHTLLLAEDFLEIVEIAAVHPSPLGDLVMARPSFASVGDAPG